MPSNITGLVDGSNGVDLTADALVTKSYVLDYYPDLLPARIRPGLWAWGNNASGELGVSDLVHRSSPIQIGALTNWKSISISGNTTNFVLAIKNDGSLWAWGDGGAGQLGLSNTLKYSSPVQVGALTNWKTISNTNFSTLSVKVDGTLWAWGSGGNGVLGLNNTSSTSSPVQIGTSSNWNNIYNSALSTYAIKTDGTLWSWGHNSFGQLGISDIVHRSSPVQVGALTNWKSVSGGYYSSYFLKTDGTLWSSGNNANGSLGLNDNTNRSSPTQIGSLTNWKIVSAGSPDTTNSSVFSIKTDGTLWAWGRNSNGELGLNDYIHRSSPTQVGSLTNWKQISCGYNAIAIKTDGTLWTWGNNINGSLGLGDLIPRSSPVQIGSLSNWKKLNSSGLSLRCNIAIKEEGIW